MAISEITFKTEIAWWVRPYIYLCAVVNATIYQMVGKEMNIDRVADRAMKGVKLHMVAD